MTRVPRQPVLSIVMPLYNKATDVDRAIASVRRQTVEQWELIVVDDGSTDDGPERVARTVDLRVVLLRQANRGVSAARNTGVDAARSTLIAFLDADDEWDPNMAAELLRLRAAHASARVFATGYRICHPSGAVRRAAVRGLPEAFASGLLLDYFRVAARSDPPLFTSAVAIDREALLAVGGFPAGIAAGEDLLTWARLAARYPVAYSREARATFFEPAASDSRPGRRPTVPDLVAAGLANIESPGCREYRAHWYRMRGVWYLDLGDTAAARAELARALQLRPGALVVWALLAVACLPARAAQRLYHAHKERRARRAPAPV